MSLESVHNFLCRLMVHFDSRRLSTLAPGAPEDLQLLMGDPRGVQLPSLAQSEQSEQAPRLRRFSEKMQGFLEAQVAATLRVHKDLFSGKSIGEFEKFSEVAKMGLQNSVELPPESSGLAFEEEPPASLRFLGDTIQSNLFFAQVTQQKRDLPDCFAHQLLCLALNRTGHPSRVRGLFEAVVSFIQKLIRYLFRERSPSAESYWTRRWDFQRRFLELLGRSSRHVFEFQTDFHGPKNVSTGGAKLGGPLLQKAVRDLQTQFLAKGFDPRSESLVRLLWACLAFVCSLLQRPEEFPALVVGASKSSFDLESLLESLTRLMLLRQCPVLAHQACRLLSFFIRFAGPGRPKSVSKSELTSRKTES